MGNNKKSVYRSAGCLESLGRNDSPEVRRVVRREYGPAVWILYPSSPLVAVLITTFIGLLLLVNAGLMMATILYSIKGPDVPLLAEVVNFFIVLLITASIYGSFLRYRPQFAGLHRRIVEGFSSYGPGFEPKEQTEIANSVRKYEHLCQYFWLGFINFCAIVLAFLKLLVELLVGEEGTGVSTPGVNTNLPISYWTPYNSSSSYTFYPTLALQLSVIFPSALSISAGDIVFVFVSQVICAELTVLGVSLDRLPTRAAALHVTRPGSSYLACYKQCLVENIKHHTHIIAFFNDFDKLTEKVILVTFCSGGVLIGAASIVILSAGNRIGSTTISVMFCLVEIVNVFILSWYGEQIYQRSDEVRLSVYSTPWYDSNVEIRRCVMIMQEVTNKPLLLRAWKIFPVNLATFLNIINAAYSYSNVMFAFNS